MKRYTDELSTIEMFILVRSLARELAEMAQENRKLARELEQGAAEMEGRAVA